MVLSETELRTLLQYNPQTGELTWLPRSAELYQKFNPDYSPEEAVRYSNVFNIKFANKPVGTTNNNGNPFVRISVGSRHNNHRRKLLDLIWIVAAGEDVATDDVVMLLDDTKPPVVTNVVKVSKHLWHLMKNPRTGISLDKNTRKYFYRILIREDGTRFLGAHKYGIDSLKEARTLRDEELKRMGLWRETLLASVAQCGNFPSTKTRP